MRVIADNGQIIEIGTTESEPTVGIVDYSRRETDDFGVTTVVPRGFARTMSVRVKVDTDDVDQLQRDLASLRAQAAHWIADDRFESLSFRGYFKEFSIDMAIPPVSFCTLTIEGLAEGGDFVENGVDPAPGGGASSMQLLQPATLTDIALQSSNVPETDYPEWDDDRVYGLGDRVIRSPSHRIFESASDNNQNSDPTGTAGLWIDIGPTNRWAMFDQALGSLTEAVGSITVTITALVAMNAVALLDVSAATVRVQAPGYARTLSPDANPGVVTFLDVPDHIGTFSVTIAGPGAVSVGTLLYGRLVGLGITEASPTAGITDYSRKETDDFGEVTVVERAWAKRMSVRALIATDALDVVSGRISSVRALPSLWIGAEGRESITVYGFFKEFSIAVGENVSILSLSVEGLSAAAKLAPIEVDPGEVGWGDIVDDDPEHPKPQDGATVGAPDGTPVGGTNAANVVAALLALGSVSDPDDIVSGALALVERQFSHSQALFDAQLLSQERKERWERLTHLDGKELATRVRSEISERIEGDTAIIERVNEIEVGATDGLSAAMAAISDEASIRAAADTAETAQRELAISLVRTQIDDEVVDLQAAILGEATTRADADAAETAQRNLAVSTLNGRIDGEVLEIEAAISSEATTRADAIAAETSERTLAISSLANVVDGQIANVVASIETEAATRASADAAETFQREQALSTLQSNLGGQIVDAMSAIDSEATTRAAADAAETSQREQAISQIELTIAGEVTDVMAAIASEATTRADADEAEASARSALAASIATDFANLNAAVVDESSARVTADEAEATAREALAATLSSDIADVSAAVESESIARVAEDGSLASLLTAVQTTVDGNSASVLMLSESVDGLRAQWGVRIVRETPDGPPKVSGIILNDNGEESRLDVLADYFGVTSTDGSYSFAEGRQIINGGSVMTVSGRPFGSTNQFVEWTGPVVSFLSECTESNALKFVKINGQGYNRGGIIAGDLRASFSNPSLGTSASIAIGPLISNGNEILVNASYSMTATQTSNYPGTLEGRNDYDAAIAAFGPVSGDGTNEYHTGTKPNNPPAGSFTMQIKKEASGLMTVGECNGSIELFGSRPVIGDAPGYITWTYSYWASVTTPDPDQNTSIRNFSANFTRSFGPGSASIQSQFISVTSTEWS